MTVLTVVLFFGGIAGLVAGAESMVRGAAAIAVRTGLSPVVIGLTVVAFGTSAPELAVSIGAAVRGEADLAVGNVVGSNIANVLLVLGVSALFGGALIVARRIVRVDVPIMLAASVALWLFARNGELSRWEGGLFVLALIGYIGWTVTEQRRSGLSPDVVPDELNLDELGNKPLWWDIGLVAIGLVLLVVGSTAMVEAATTVAAALGVSELVIGLTVVAVGTSLPEIATSVLAAIRGERDLAVGNAVGSNLFNILAVLGITALVSPSALPVPIGAITQDLPVAIGVAIACLPIFAIGYQLARWEGGVFLTFYAIYLGWLVIDATNHPFADSYRVAVFGFVIPLTVLTFAVLAVRYRRRGNTDSQQDSPTDSTPEPAST